MAFIKDKGSRTIYDQVGDFPEQIAHALECEIGEIPSSDKICICGMGASALAGDVLSDYVNICSDTPIFVMRGIELPGWVDSETIVVAISYSGTTKEVLAAYDAARARGSRIICVTSGGDLADRCRADRNMLIGVPTGLQSRGALGYMIGYLASILENIGICSSATELRSLLPKLKVEGTRLKESNSSMVNDIARRLFGKIPVIYSLANMRSAAIRWKTQINENSKFISFCGSLPEFNHNEIIGWTDDDANSIFMPLILYDDDATELVAHMTDVSIELLTENDLNLIVCNVSGSSNLEKNLKCIMLGDFVSLRLAYLRNTDPGSDLPVSEGKVLIIDSGS